MTFDEWFLSKQGEPYDSMYMFARDAWRAANEQCALWLESHDSDGGRTAEAFRKANLNAGG